MNNTTQECSELYHHGILGMKWGVRRFQNKDGSLTTAGKKRYDSDGDENSGETKKKKFSLKKSGSKEDTKNAASKEDESEQKKIPSKEKDPEAYEAAKQKAIKSGSAKDVLKFKGDLTQQEMQSAISRIRWEQDMQNLSGKEISQGQAKADEFFNKVEKATKYADTSIKAWNTVANVYNAVNKDSGLLPTISTDITKSNRATRIAEKKRKEQEKKDSGKSKTNENTNKDTANKENTTTKDTTTETRNSNTTKTEHWTGTVEGTGTNSNKNTKTNNTKSEDYYEPFDVDSDADWVYEYGGSTSTSNMSSENVERGKAKVEQFLLEKKGR